MVKKSSFWSLFIVYGVLELFIGFVTLILIIRGDIKSLGSMIIRLMMVILALFWGSAIVLAIKSRSYAMRIALTTLFLHCVFYSWYISSFNTTLDSVHKRVEAFFYSLVLIPLIIFGTGIAKILRDRDVSKKLLSQS